MLQTNQVAYEVSTKPVKYVTRFKSTWNRTTPEDVGTVIEMVDRQGKVAALAEIAYVTDGSITYKIIAEGEA